MDRADAADYAEQVGAKFATETSSKTGEGIQELFKQIAEDYVQSAGSGSAGPRQHLTMQQTPDTAGGSARWGGGRCCT